jgi:hypothetical protein
LTVHVAVAWPLLRLGELRLSMVVPVVRSVTTTVELENTVPAGAATVMVPCPAPRAPAELVVKSTLYVTAPTPAAFDDSATEGARTEEPAAAAVAGATNRLTTKTANASHLSAAARGA